MTIRKSLNLVLWERAIPLSTGRVRLAPEEMQAQWKAAHEKPFLLAVQAELPPGAQSAKELREAVSTVATSRATIMQQIDEWLIPRLRSGEIIGLGFEPPRTVESEPVVIPRECWRYGLGSGSGKIAVDGLTFIEVRLLTSAALRRIQAAWEMETVPPHPAPKRGRRGSATDIAEAFEALLAAGRIDLDASAKSHYPAIRDWLRYRRPDAGYSATKPTDETIRKTFQPMFDQARKSRQR